MPTSPIITFIVPMYNVEKYIGNCISSICSQNINNIEVILIDDGSPDDSVSICELIAQKDDRIRIVRKENEGVSSARNLGLSLAIGDYIVFVDGDDCISPDYSSYMLGLAENSDADFVISQLCHTIPEDSKILREKTLDYVVWSNEQAVYELLYPGKITIGCWNKMFKRSFLIKNNIFFSNKFFMGEGLKFIVEVAQTANVIVAGNKKVYFYRKDNDVSATTVVNVPKYINALDALASIKSGQISPSKSFSKAIQHHEYIATFYALRAILFTKQLDQYKTEYQKYLNRLRSQIFELPKIDIPFKFKFKIMLFAMSPRFSSLLIGLFK